MSAVVADTHTVIWYLTAPENLSVPAETALALAEDLGDAIYVSTITIVEVVYLVEKGRLPFSVLDILLKTIEDTVSVFTAVSVDYDIAVSVQQVPRSIVPDMPDRIITATALHLKLPLVTRDHKIQAANITTIW